jgi:hypothetical protein
MSGAEMSLRTLVDTSYWQVLFQQKYMEPCDFPYRKTRLLFLANSSWASIIDVASDSWMQKDYKNAPTHVLSYESSYRPRRRVHVSCFSRSPVPLFDSQKKMESCIDEVDLCIWAMEPLDSKDFRNDHQLLCGNLLMHPIQMMSRKLKRISFPACFAYALYTLSVSVDKPYNFSWKWTSFKFDQRYRLKSLEFRHQINIIKFTLMYNIFILYCICLYFLPLILLNIASLNF